MRHVVELELVKLGENRHQASRHRTFIYTQCVPWYHQNPFINQNKLLKNFLATLSRTIPCSCTLRKTVWCRWSCCLLSPNNQQFRSFEAVNLFTTGIYVSVLLFRSRTGQLFLTITEFHIHEGQCFIACKDAMPMVSWLTYHEWSFSRF